MKKMATQFQSWKKKLYHTDVKKNLTPNFNARAYAKLRPYWNDFIQYKTSEVGEQRVRRNQQNARQKEYHHNMGSSGYTSAIPKWEKWNWTFLPRGSHQNQSIGLNVRRIGFSLMGEDWT
jgi:hypothetical protein